MIAACASGKLLTAARCCCCCCIWGSGWLCCQVHPGGGRYVLRFVARASLLVSSRGWWALWCGGSG
ncbi:hypothetical protein BRADI_1g70575v3 [Brachypodium distachyon]|uniref:Secreted protein n=1 Tax=Brachypodium distachyon TaxID=15368 RepID=A0A2K2DUI1_BRADI|nr:hypothetical protein BRADI_1g70575v3 [Brachypodium distachyon]